MADTLYTMFASKRVRRVRFSCLWYYIHYLSITLYTHSYRLESLWIIYAHSWSELSEPFSRHTLYLLHPFYRKFKNTFFQHLFFSFAASKRNKKLHIETFICLYFLVHGLGLFKNKAICGHPWNISRNQSFYITFVSLMLIVRQVVKS